MFYPSRQQPDPISPKHSALVAFIQRLGFVFWAYRVQEGVPENTRVIYAYERNPRAPLVIISATGQWGYRDRGMNAVRRLVDVRNQADFTRLVAGTQTEVLLRRHKLNVLGTL